MNFVALAVHLRHGPARQSLGIEHAPFAHAAVLHALSAVAPDLGRELHDMPRRKPFALAIPPTAQQQQTVLLLRFMAEAGLNYAQALINYWSLHSTMQLGSVTCEVNSVTFATPPWPSLSTWADLQRPPESATIRIQFLTPTAFMRNGYNGTRYTSVVPEPAIVFGGLSELWRKLRGPDLPSELEQRIQAGGCVITRHHIQTMAFHTEGRTQIGFLGDVTYRCLSTPEDRAALQALARLASFAGVGYQATRGMGLVQVEIGAA